MNKFIVSFIVANLIGAVFLWLTARELPVDEVGAYLSSADKAHLGLWSLVFVGVYLVCHGARVVRWYDLVRPLNPGLSPWLVHRVCAVGFAAILLLPLRLGELVRPYLLSRRTELELPAVLGTAVVERVIDGLVITGLLFVTIATYDGGQQTAALYSMGGVSAGIFLGALAVILAAFGSRELTVSLVRRVFGVVSVGLAEKLAGLLEGFIDGFRALIEQRALGRFLGLTVLYWGTNVLSMWLLARFGFGLDVGAWDIATVMAVLVIGLMVPAGPAMAGNFEFFMAMGLGLFVSVELFGPQVAAFAGIVHILQFVVIVIPGFIVMWLEPQSRRLIALSQGANAQVQGSD